MMVPVLIDIYGRPIERQVLKEEQAGVTTRMVRRNDALHPAVGLTPQRLAAILRDSIEGDPEAYLALAEDMEERDLHYSGVLAIRKRQVSGLEITVEAAGDDEVSQRAADLIRDVIDRDGFVDELIDILDAIGKGFSATEIIWDTSEGQWRPKKLAWRDPRWFTFDHRDGETPLLRGPNGHEPLNPYQWIFHAAKVKSGLPIRGGIARAAAWSFMFKSYTMKDWAIFCEAYGQPLRLGKYGSEATDADKETLLRAVSNIGTDYAAIVPASMAVEFVKADISGSHQLYQERANFLDYQVSKLVLGQTGTTDAIAGGHAVGKTHDGVRDDIEKADARQLAATLNRDLVRPVVDFELGPQKKYPRISIGRPDEVDVDKLVDNVVKLVPLGLKVGMAAMRDKIGMPDPEADEELLVSKTSTPTDPQAGQAPVDPSTPIDPSKAKDVTSSTILPHGGDAIDDFAASLGAQWEELVLPLTEGLEDKIAAATSPEEARSVIADHFAAMDSKTLTDRLARAFFATRLAGSADDSLS